MTDLSKHDIQSSKSSLVFVHPYDYTFPNGVRATIMGGKTELPEAEKGRTVVGPVKCISYSMHGGNEALAIYQGNTVVEAHLKDWVVQMSEVASERLRNPILNWDIPNNLRFGNYGDYFRMVVFMFTPQLIAHFGLSACMPIEDQLTPHHLFARRQDRSPIIFHNGGMDDITRMGSDALVLTHYSGFTMRTDTHVSVATANLNLKLLLENKSGIYARKQKIGTDFGSNKGPLSYAVGNLHTNSILALVCPPPLDQKFHP